MKFAVGYQITANREPFYNIVKDYREYISEVYFSWPGFAGGRPEALQTDWTAQRSLELELSEICKMGVKLDLLFNGNCYGDGAVSIAMKERILSLLEYLGTNGCLPDIVTTTSPFVAHIIRSAGIGVELRASVNMRIGTLQAFSYASKYFDSFYIQRDYQRNLNYVRSICDWAKENDKKICVLANSGCLRFCPSQTFHDNLISHSNEAEKMQNVKWNPHLCRSVFSDVSNYAQLLKETWIRPEDICHYEGLADVVKLATRQHSHPRMVIGAYASAKYEGDLLELLEPGFSSQFFPYYIENSLFPDDWFEKSGSCLNGCTNCGYCEDVLNKVLCSYCL